MADSEPTTLSPAPRAILIVKLSAIGDVAQSLFALPALSLAYPGARIGWVATRGCHWLLEGHPDLDTLHVFERGAWGGMVKSWRQRRQILAFGAELRRERYDLVIDLQGLARSALITLVAGARRRAGFSNAREGAPLVYNLRYHPGTEPVHAIDRYRGLLAMLGAPWNVPESASAFGVAPESPATRSEAEEILARVGARPRVAFQPAARWPTKLWPTAQFAELARRLIDRGVQVAVLGGPDERESTRELLAGAPGAVDLVGTAGLAVLPAVLRRFDLLVTCDSGPMHIAAAVGTPTVALFGPTDPQLTGPYGAGHSVLQSGAECSPCFSRSCRMGDLRCLTGIDVDRVEEAVWARLEPGHSLPRRETGDRLAP